MDNSPYWKEKISWYKKLRNKLILIKTGNLSLEDYMEEVNNKIHTKPLTLKEFEKNIVIESLLRNNYNQVKCAEELGISRDKLYRIIREHSLRDEKGHLKKWEI